MMNVLDKLFSNKKVDALSEEQSFMAKIEDLNNKQLLQNKFFTGVDVKSNNLIFEECFRSIFISGDAGTGKTNTAELIAAIYLLSNSDQIKLHIVVPFNIGSDYQSVRSYSQVNTITNPTYDFFEEIILEIRSRIDRIKSLNCVDLNEMEQKCGLKLTRHLIIIEDLLIFLHQLRDNDDFRSIARMAGCVGIYFLYVSQRGMIDEDLPKSFMISMFSRRMFNRFKCYTENGEVLTFPYINRDNLKKLLDKKIKPLTSKSLIMKD